MRSHAHCTMAFCMPIWIAIWFGVGFGAGEKRASKIAYVDVERIMLCHPMSGELTRLVSELMALEAGLRTESAQPSHNAAHGHVEEHEEGEFKLLPTEIGEPTEPKIQAVRVDLGSVKLSARRLTEVVNQMREEAKEQLGLLINIKLAELREEYINRIQSLLERQSPKWTRLRVRLLSPSLNDEERSMLIAESEKLDAELDQQLDELKRKRNEELQSWRANMEREWDEQFSRLMRDIEGKLSESVQLLHREPEEPQWLNIRELWDALSPRAAEPVVISFPQRKLDANELEMRSHWDRQWKGAINLMGREWLTSWQAAMRKSIVEFARMYALQRGFKAITTDRGEGAVDITDEVIALLRRSACRR